MQVIQLGWVPRPITGYGSREAFFSPVAGIHERCLAQLHLGAGGRLGCHDAGAPQLMVVLQSEGEVSGQNPNAVALRPGAVVVWELGESQETRNRHGHSHCGRTGRTGRMGRIGSIAKMGSDTVPPD